MTANVNTYGMNALSYAAAEQAMFTKKMNELSGYETISTFWFDLSIAEVYGPEAVKETCERVMKEWSRNPKMFTEFVLALNHKSWEHDSRRQTEMSQLYADLFYKMHDWIYENWDRDGRDYYFSVTD